MIRDSVLLSVVKQAHWTLFVAVAISSQWMMLRQDIDYPLLLLIQLKLCESSLSAAKPNLQQISLKDPKVRSSRHGYSNLGNLFLSLHTAFSVFDIAVFTSLFFWCIFRLKACVFVLWLLINLLDWSWFDYCWDVPESLVMSWCQAKIDPTWQMKNAGVRVICVILISGLSHPTAAVTSWL